MIRVIVLLCAILVTLATVSLVLNQMIAFSGVDGYDNKRALIQLNVGVYLFPILLLLVLCLHVSVRSDLGLRSLVMPVTLLVAAFACHSLLMHYRPLGALVLVAGEVDSFVISLYEAVVVNLLYIVGLSFVVYLSVSPAWSRQIRFLVGGVLTVIGILLPKIIEGYGYLGYYCLVGRCSARDRYVMDYFASVIAMSASLLVVYLICVFASSKMWKLPRVPKHEFGWEK